MVHISGICYVLPTAEFTARGSGLELGDVAEPRAPEGGKELEDHRAAMAQEKLLTSTLRWIHVYNIIYICIIYMRARGVIYNRNLHLL